MNSIENLVVPKFMFLLNNKSRSQNPRKEAFKFRDGIIIVSTPIYSESNTYGCLQKVCRAFGVGPPGRQEMLPIILGVTATRNVQDISGFAEDIKMRKSESQSARAKASERFIFTHFNTQRLFTSATPHPSQLIRRPTTSPPDQLHGTSAHVERQFVDGTNWQDRLVPSVKMEAARRKYVARLIEAGAFFPKEYPRGADEQPTRAAPILLTQDEQTRPIGTHTETIVVRHNWRRIEAWRQGVAWESGRWPSSNINWNREEERRMWEHQDWRRSSLEPVRKNVQGAESKNEEMGVKKGNAQVTGPVQGGDQVRPTKILSRKEELALARLCFDPEEEVIGRRIKGTPRMMANDARKRIRENREKGKDAVFEELKSFSAAMKLATAPPEDILSVIGKGN
jgi:hypothetical protein